MTLSSLHLSSTEFYPTSDQTLVSALSTSPYSFLQPPPSLHTAALVLAKRYLDPLANSISDAQGRRLQERRKKRKRGVHDGEQEAGMLRLKQVHLEGFGLEQIWEQARRVLDASVQEIEAHLPGLIQDTVSTEWVEGDHGINGSSPNRNGVVHLDQEGIVINTSDEDNPDEDSPLLEELSEDSNVSNAEIVDDVPNGKELDGQADVEISDIEEDTELDDSDLQADHQGTKDHGETFVPDKHGLNDAFFSIDNFNRTSEFLEQQDARGDPDDGAASDEEEIDWDADPMFHPPSSASKPLLNGNKDRDYESDSDGPTFGNADLYAPDTDSDTDSIGSSVVKNIDVTSNTNDVKYADFFAPPPRVLTKSSRRRALPKTQPPPSTKSQQISPDEIQRTISLVRRDLFEDDPSPHASGSDSPPDGTVGLSSHQKRQAALSAQIRQLEAANVAKRDWTLSGEARAAERPMNSLLEEDLEFERVGKPVVVVTKEVSEDIEALIKRRILAREFDEVVRRRPGLDPVVARRDKLELDDTKDKRGLAEIYEEEHLKRTDPTGHGDKKDEKVKKQHEEIERLWREVSGKLDALSSWHFKPKPPEANVNVVSDVLAIRMEDARPSGVGVVGDIGSGSMLAPQEVYRAGEEKIGDEIVAGGLPVGREEMSREEKLRRRRREKERNKKSGGSLETRKGGEKRVSKDGDKAKEKKGLIADLKKGGVRVIGKKGEVRDVAGKMVKGMTNVQGGGGFKL